MGFGTRLRERVWRAIEWLAVMAVVCWACAAAAPPGGERRGRIRNAAGAHRVDAGRLTGGRRLT